MFSQVSVCPQRGVVYTPLAGRSPQLAGSHPPPPSSWLLQRTVRILLECILVNIAVSAFNGKNFTRYSRVLIVTKDMKYIWPYKKKCYIIVFVTKIVFPQDFFFTIHWWWKSSSCETSDRKKTITYYWNKWNELRKFMTSKRRMTSNVIAVKNKKAFQ